MADELNHEVTFKPGELVIQEKTNSDSLFVIKKGQLAVYKLGKNDQRIPIAVVSSGEYIGEGALLTGKTHSANVMALTEVTAVRLTKDMVDKHLKQVPGWLSALTVGLVNRLNHANELLRRNNIVDENLNSAMITIEKRISQESA